MLTRPRARVLHVITHLDSGGAQDNTLLTVEGLSRDRYIVDIAGGPGSQEARARTAAGQLFSLESLRRPLLAPGAARTFSQLRHLCAGYDIVHTHGSKAGVLGRIAAASCGVPVVIHTIHGLPVNDSMSWPVRRVLLAAERAAARRCDRIICVCETNAREAIDLGIARPEQLRVIVSGVDDSSLSTGDGATVRRELAIPMDAPIVGSITRLMEQKAPLDLVAAAIRITEVRPDTHVLVVGDGPMREEVAAAAAGHDRIHLLGHRTDIANLLDAIDVMVFTSLWEGLGRALTESVLAGLPVVATAVNGVPELVDVGRSGLLVPPAQPDLVAEGTLTVLDLADRGRSWGAWGASRIRGKFSISDMVSGIDDLYQECLTRKREAVAVS